MNTNIKILLSILFLFISYSKSFSQPQTEWVQRFNSPGNYNDYVTDMVIDKSGNVYLTGYVQVNDTDQNFVTIKYNTQGVEQWVRYYDGPDHREDKPVAIAVDDSGNVFVSGTSSLNFLTIKYNSFGNTIWSRRNQNGYGMNAMILDNYGNVYVTGIAFGVSSEDILTIKYDNYGDLIWIRYFNGVGNGYDIPLSIIHDMDNNIFISAQITGSFLIPIGVVIKYSSLGDLTWISGNSDSFVFFSSYSDNFYNLYSVGHSEIYNNTDINLSKFNFSGNLEWSRNYNRSDTVPDQDDFYKGFTLDRQFNPIFTCVNSDNVLRYDITTVKYDSAGNFLWVRIFGESNSNDESNSITTDQYGNIYVCGFVDTGLFAKYIIVKYDTFGVLKWFISYNNNNSFTSHSARKVLVDTLGNIYVTGISQGSGTGYDIATIKYSQLTNLNQTNDYEINDYLLFQNYPNPFNPLTLIKYFIPIKSNVSVKVYNVLGTEVSTLVNEIENEGTYKIQFDGTNLPSGIYICTLTTDGIIRDRKKLVLVK